MEKRAGFTFKQFHINHDLCGMKVGTDGILLGGWSQIKTGDRVLDIGTGSGLIALMLAQKSAAEAEILAIDIDQNAVLQASENVAASPFGAAVTTQYISLQELALTSDKKFDLMISNPPYFTAGQELGCASRQAARHTGELLHQEILASAESMLSPVGRLELVLPYQAAQVLVDSAIQQGGWAIEFVAVHTRPHKEPSRALLRMFRGDGVKHKTLCIHKEGGGYTDQYISITRDFYLKM